MTVATPDLRPLTPADGEHLRAFHCAREGSPLYARVVEAAIGALPEVLEDEQSPQGVGVWIGDELAGVVRWRPIDELDAWKITLLAVAVPHQGLGYGKLLLRHVAALAAHAGAVALTGNVDRANQSMRDVVRSAARDERRAVEQVGDSIAVALLPSDGPLNATAYRRRLHAKSPRNAPCTCGSGLKFKRCHGGEPATNQSGDQNQGIETQ